MSRYFFGNRRRIAAFLTMLGGIGIAIAILSSGNGGGTNFLTAFLGTNTGTPSNLNFKLGGISNTTATSSDTTAADNLTDQIAKTYGAQILSLNEKGMKKTNQDAPITIPGDQTLSDIINQGLAQQIPVPTFDVKDIRIGKTDDKNAVLAYLKALTDAYDRDFKTTPENFFLSIAGAIQNNTGALEKSADATSNFITDLLGIAVPPSWEDLHLKMLNIWQRRLTLANTILKSADDPLKAAVALQAITDNLDAEESFLGQFWTTLRTQGIVSTNS